MQCINTQASGAEFDMVMSTKEQETFETALVTPASLDTIKAGLSKIDVRQVRGRYPGSSSACHNPYACQSPPTGS
jgi:hypothetical protein